jgi:phenylalanyl-tRNA synthetase beta chain
LTYAFVSEEDLAAIHAPAPVVRIKNPLSEDRQVLRTSLLPGLLDALKRARRRGETGARLFSVGTRFLPPLVEQAAAAQRARPRLPGDALALPSERPSFAAVIAGPRADYLALKPPELDVYDAKGIAIELVERLTGRRASVEPLGATEGTRHLHPRGAAAVLLAGKRVGVFGPLHPHIVERLDLGGSALVIEVDLEALEAVGKLIPRFVPIPKLPAVSRDISLVVHEHVPAGQVLELIREAAGELCESVELQAVFSEGSVPKEHRSLTYRLVYRDPKASTDADNARTLTDNEVDQQQARVLAIAEQKLGATLRG